LDILAAELKNARQTVCIDGADLDFFFDACFSL
jgi:hypothetical protein